MHLTLLQLNNLVRQTIEYSMPEGYWVEAELLDCHESNGHCYMELVQKDEYSNTPVAKARANCWRNVWLTLRPRFERTTGQQLHAGMKVLLQVKASFHEAYGFSWNIINIDATYTIGDMMRRRQEIIETLRKEGVFDLNKSLVIPMFAQRIAVVSSETAAGYGDFCDQLAANDYGFAFKTILFPAVMQGEQVEQSVIAALDRINERTEDFDVVVIIRGGGSTSDLSGFDTLALAENVANFPLPIITGIGHDRDESVLDMISCVRVKTPTAAADYLINNLLTTYDAIADMESRLVDTITERISKEKMRLASLQAILPTLFYKRKANEDTHISALALRLQSVVTRRLQRENGRIESAIIRLPFILSGRLEREGHRIDLLEKRTEAVNPIHILRRGYGIALHDGKAVTSPSQVSHGDMLEIVLAEGRLPAKVEKDGAKREKAAKRQGNK